MPDRKAEHDPEEIPLIEPDEDPEYDPEDMPAAPTTLTASRSSANGSGDRDYDYRTEVLTLDQVADGKTLTGMLADASADGWHLVQVIDAGDRRVVLFRKVKKADRERRSVGFAPPGRS